MLGKVLLNKYDLITRTVLMYDKKLVQLRRNSDSSISIQKRKQFDLMISFNGFYEVKIENMDRHKVTSSNIESIGYEDKKNLLEVIFKSRAVYLYSNVPETVFKEFLSSQSKGTYFQKNIKDKYPTQRIS